MNVFLTFDIEVWCNGWDDLDRAFPGSFQRYVYGRSPDGDYALPKTLAILNQHGLKGVFFVEPLFATRFGAEHLEIIVRLIREAGHEIQLHLHPEWTDEAREPIIENCATKRQHLSYYTLNEQTALIAHGKKMLEAAGSGPICAFRSGSFAANRDTFEALRRNAIWLDTSLNRCYAVSAPDLRREHAFNTAFVVEGVTTYPVTVLKDGFGKDRPAQVGACSLSEMRDALLSAQQAGVRDFVVVSHNFEMLKPGSPAPDWIVVKRFERLCAFLAQQAEKFNVRGFGEDLRLTAGSQQAPPEPQAKWLSTSQRYVEQIWRRLQL
ncbi:MAG: polysaccharide deacetylase [Gallionella sp.]|nr:polysaccharide deacetylase [Gallionella sp.]